jgi:deoxycytidine triphosphate deaminase
MGAEEGGLQGAPFGRPADHPFAAQEGAVLGAQAIQDLLQQGWLFEDRTWHRDRLRAAGYDLVIAADDLRIPDPRNPEKFRYFTRGRPVPHERFILQPGEFAFVTTQERVCLPWTVAANVAVRNRFARRGLLILTGLLVDPGYGLRADGTGWRREPQRLHFGIANVGRDPITIVAGQDAIASLQFLKVHGSVLLKEIPPPADEDPVGGFLLFTDLERRLGELKDDVGATESRFQNVMVFGLYVIIASLFGATIAFALQAIDNPTLSDRLTTMLEVIAKHPWPATLLAVGLVSVAVALASLVLIPFARLVKRRRKRR